MKRLFRFTDYNSGEKKIEVFTDQEIEKEFNVYGLFYVDADFESNLKSYKKSRNEALSEFCNYQELKRDELTFSHLKEFFEEFEFEYGDSKSNWHYGRPSKFIKYTDEENVQDLEGFYDQDHNEIDESDIPDEDVNEFVRWWDGSNHILIYLTGLDVYDPEDVTDDFIESFEEKKFIGNNRNPQNDGGSWDEYYFSLESKRLWVKHVTLWQGTRNSYEIIEDDHEIDVIFVLYSDEEDIDKYRPSLREQYGQNLRVIQPNQSEPIMLAPFENPSFANYEIFSKDNIEFIESTKIKGGDNTRGADFYNLGARIIKLSWSHWQGEKDGWFKSSEAEMEQLIST